MPLNNIHNSIYDYEYSRHFLETGLIIKVLSSESISCKLLFLFNRLSPDLTRKLLQYHKHSLINKAGYRKEITA